jgi:hypothetical protein
MMLDRSINITTIHITRLWVPHALQSVWLGVQYWVVASRLGVTDMHARILESLCRGEEHKGEFGDRHSVMTC